MKVEVVLYRAIFKSMIGRYAVYGLNLASIMIMARLFTPEIFGAVAAIMVFYTFFQLMAEAGLGPAIINLKALNKEDLNGLFGLTVLAGTILALIFAALSSFFQDFYGLERVGSVVPYVAVSLVFFSCSIVPTALLLRQQSFFHIAAAGGSAEILSTGVTAYLSTIIDPLHSLAAKSVVSSGTLFFMNWYSTVNTEFGRPRLGLKFSAIRPILGFSGYQLGFNFINYFSRNLDNILVGKYLGVGALGVYDKAIQLMRYPLMLLTFAMTPAIQPVIRKYSENPARVEEVHRPFAFKLSLIGALVGLVLFFLAEWIVLVVLGAQWQQVTPIIKILAIGVPVQVLLSSSGSFYQAMNRVDLLLLSGVFSASFMVVAITVGVICRDMELLCWLLVGAYHVNFLHAYYLMYKKIFNVEYYKYLFNMIPAALVVLAMIAWMLFL